MADFKGGHHANRLEDRRSSSCARRIDHPAVDPLPAAQDPCGFGGTTLKNVLTINDVEIANTP